jgi:hypothetical protein
MNNTNKKKQLLIDRITDIINSNDISTVNIQTYPINTKGILNTTITISCQLSTILCVESNPNGQPQTTIGQLNLEEFDTTR